MVLNRSPRKTAWMQKISLYRQLFKSQSTPWGGRRGWRATCLQASVGCGWEQDSCGPEGGVFSSG